MPKITRQHPVHWRTQGVEGHDIAVSAFSCTCRGKRESNEDALSLSTPGDALCVAVFDGHYGGKCAKWCARQLPKQMHTMLQEGGFCSTNSTLHAMLNALTLSPMPSSPSAGASSIDARRDTTEEPDEGISILSDSSQPQSEASAVQLRTSRAGMTEETPEAALMPPPPPSSPLPEMLSKCMVELDKQWLAKAETRKPPLPDGSTATVLLLSTTLGLVANAGDSRAVACVHGKALPLSRDHTGKREDERARVEALGGEVSVTGRVRGKLMVTRAMGDWPYKQGLHEIIADPELSGIPLSKALRFILVACDGIWDVFSSEDAIRFVRKGLVQASPKRVLEDLIAAAFEGGSEDNMSAVLVVFDHGDGALVQDEGPSDGSALGSDDEPSGSEVEEPDTPQ